MARERQHISQRQLEATLGREGIPPRFQSRTFAAFTATTVRPAQRPLWLESFLVGCHHRISHAALVAWLERNQKYQRDSA